MFFKYKQNVKLYYRFMNTTNENDKRIAEVELNLIKLSGIQYKETKRI